LGGRRAGDKAGEVAARVGEITPQGGTNIATALDLGYRTALKHYQPGSINRVVLLTDGAANLGDVKPDALKQKVEAHRKQGIALDCFGIGWEGYDDQILEALSRNGDGRYGFINTPEEAATEFAGQLAGALRVAASDVKVQVEFNPRRVTAYRQIGYAKHQLKKEQFRDNTVDAAEIGAAESGNALYVVEVNPRGEGDLATVRVRFKVPGTSDYREHEWPVPFTTKRAAARASESRVASRRNRERVFRMARRESVRGGGHTGSFARSAERRARDLRRRPASRKVRVDDSAGEESVGTMIDMEHLDVPRSQTQFGNAVAGETLFRWRDCKCVRARSRATELHRQVRSQTKFGNESGIWRRIHESRTDF
jgi:hypothetical protein